MLKLKVYMIDGKVKKVIIPEVDEMNQKTFDYVLEKLVEHKIEPHEIAMIRERR